MKSAAFNLAFKVHRNELSFPEALLRAVEAKAQEDYIEALNSLAGETRYSAADLETLIQQAQQQLQSSSAGKNKQIEAIEETLRKLKKTRHEHQESIKSYQHHISQLKPTVIPGLNAFLILLVGFMLGFIPLLLRFNILAIAIFLITLILLVVSVIQDIEKLKKERVELSRKEEEFKQGIERMLTAIEGLNQQIEEKQDILNRLMPRPAEEAEAPAAPDEGATE